MNAQPPESAQIGSVIKAWRIYRGLKPTQLAKVSGVSKGYLSLVEAHQIKQPGNLKLNKLAQGLNVSLADLINYQMPPPPGPSIGGQSQVNSLPMTIVGFHSLQPDVVGEQIQQILKTARLSEDEKQQIGARILDMTQYFVQRMTTARRLYPSESDSAPDKIQTMT